MKIAGITPEVRKLRGPMSDDPKLILYQKKGEDHHRFGIKRS